MGLDQLDGSELLGEELSHVCGHDLDEHELDDRADSERPVLFKLKKLS